MENWCPPYEHVAYLSPQAQPSPHPDFSTYLNNQIQIKLSLQCFIPSLFLHICIIKYEFYKWWLDPWPPKFFINQHHSKSYKLVIAHHGDQHGLVHSSMFRCLKLMSKALISKLGDICHCNLDFGWLCGAEENQFNQNVSKMENNGSIYGTESSKI